MEGGIGVCGVAVLLSFLCGIPVNKFPHCGVAVISNPTVCDVCAFKPTVFGETKLFAVLRLKQSQYSLCRLLLRFQRDISNYSVPLPGQVGLYGSFRIAVQQYGNLTVTLE